MTENILLKIIFLAFISVGCPHIANCAPIEHQAKFISPTGEIIEWDISAETIRTPRSIETKKLHNCSDEIQLCIHDDNGFVFSYFRNCDLEYRGTHRLKYTRKTVGILHTNVWFTFDEGPNYLFHYVYGKGVVGVYAGPTKYFDFRKAIGDQDFLLSNLTEYVVSGSDGFGACKNE